MVEETAENNGHPDMSSTLGANATRLCGKVPRGPRFSDPLPIEAIMKRE